MKNITDMTIFITIVQEGSITQAAKRLGLSLAVCSKRLLNLEARLKIKLLHRTTRRQELTDEGTVYFEHCLHINKEIESVEENLADMQKTVQGVLRVTVPASFGRKHISPIVAQFIKRYPKIKLQLMMTDQLIDIIENRIDIAVRVGPLTDSSLIAVLLANNRRVLCASPTYLQRMGEPQEPNDLSAHQCIILSSVGALHDTWHFKNRQVDTQVPISGVMTTNNGEAIRDAAIGGLGIANKSLWDVYQHIQNGELQTLLEGYPLPPANIYAVYHKNQFLTAKVRVWIDFLKEHFDDKTCWE
jgi:DNA-binding transcriptional LysR family regulator